MITHCPFCKIKVIPTGDRRCPGCLNVIEQQPVEIKPEEIRNGKKCDSSTPYASIESASSADKHACFPDQEPAQQIAKTTFTQGADISSSQNKNLPSESFKKSVPRPKICEKCGKKISILGNYGNNKIGLCFDCSQSLKEMLGPVSMLSDEELLSKESLQQTDHTANEIIALEIERRGGKASLSNRVSEEHKSKNTILNKEPNAAVLKGAIEEIKVYCFIIFGLALISVIISFIVEKPEYIVSASLYSIFAIAIFRSHKYIAACTFSILLICVMSLATIVYESVYFFHLIVEPSEAFTNWGVRGTNIGLAIFVLKLSYGAFPVAFRIRDNMPRLEKNRVKNSLSLWKIVSFILLSIVFCCLSAFFIISGLLKLNEKFDLSIQAFSPLILFPIGSVCVGFLCSLGYGIPLFISGRKISVFDFIFVSMITIVAGLSIYFVSWRTYVESKESQTISAVSEERATINNEPIQTFVEYLTNNVVWNRTITLHGGGVSDSYDPPDLEIEDDFISWVQIILEIFGYCLGGILLLFSAMRDAKFTTEPTIEPKFETFK